MPRVKQPAPEDILLGLDKLANELTSYEDDAIDSVEVIQRVYGRKSGNFKAIGWEVEIGIIDGKKEVQYLRVILHDDVAEGRMQTTLWFWV